MFLVSGEPHLFFLFVLRLLVISFPVQVFDVTRDRLGNRGSPLYFPLPFDCCFSKMASICSAMSMFVSSLSSSSSVDFASVTLILALLPLWPSLLFFCAFLLLTYISQSSGLSLNHSDTEQSAFRCPFC